MLWIVILKHVKNLQKKAKTILQAIKKQGVSNLQSKVENVDKSEQIIVDNFDQDSDEVEFKDMDFLDEFELQTSKNDARDSRKQGLGINRFYHRGNRSDEGFAHEFVMDLRCNANRREA